MKPRIYTYKITFEEIPHFYFGVHKERKFEEEYWGSPVTHKWMWEFYTPRKQILEVFDRWEEAREIECRLILPSLNNPLCLNEAVGQSMSLSSRVKGGQTVTPKKAAAARSNLKKALAAFTPEQRSEHGRKLWGEGIGLASISPDERVRISRANGVKVGQMFKDQKRGVCGIPPEEHSARMGNTNKQKWKCPECDYVSNARWMNAHMLKEHNLSSNAKVKW